jgi:di/tricarboxylate transporter
VAKVPLAKKPRDWTDLVAFLAVLLTGVVLLVYAHLTVTSLTATCAALVGLFAAYRSRRT